MTSKKITNLTELTDLADGDWLVAVDVSDTTMSVAGTNKKISAQNARYAVQGGSRTVNAQTGTSYTLAVTDARKIITITNAAAIDLTIPTDLTANLPIGVELPVFQLGAGKISAVPEGGVASYRTRGQGSRMILTKVAADTWVVNGDIEAVA